ncbi:MAG: outer membrane beta-barrel protein, partial [Pseudomonadota bacterium]
MTKSAVALLATTAIAQAGGVERSAQSMSILFEEGTYAELSFSHVHADVSGASSFGGASSGDVATDYNNFALRYRQDVTNELSFALVLENHIGADVRYETGTGYQIAGSQAELTGQSVTAIARYEFPSSFSVYGGVRAAQSSGEVSLPTPYTLSTNTDTAVGYLVGVSYEVPEIALRVNLTYNSEYTHELESTENGAPTGSFDTTIPQSLHLEAQSGIAEDTLLFGSVRWVDWTSFDITPVGFAAASGGNSLVDYDNDSTTYTLGVARRMTEAFATSVRLTFEPESNTRGSNLGPTDGRVALGLGGNYTMPSGLEISAGVEYSWLGNTRTLQTDTPFNIFGNFSGNTSLAAGITIGMSF